MKKLYYKGPSGDIEIKPPLSIRVFQSSWFLAGLTGLFVLWGGYYLYGADKTIYLSRPLSPEHHELASDCMACHVPFIGAPNESCASSDCHQDVVSNSLHNTMDVSCTSCHPVHTEGELIKVDLENKDCDECHKKLEKDPDSIFYPKNYEKREVSYVSREIFRHKQHGLPYYRCWNCHCTGNTTIDTPMRDLFKMDSCLICHEKQCIGCHGTDAEDGGRRAYHATREKRPREKTCIGETFVPDLMYKTYDCTDRNNRARGFLDMKVCETGEPVTEYGQEPETSPGDTAEPEIVNPFQ